MAHGNLKAGELEYAAFNFDVNGDKSLYNAVYAAMGGHAIPNGSDSSYLVLYGHKAQIVAKMEEINAEQAAKGKRGIRYKIRRTHPDEAAEVREDSINALCELTAFVTQSMLDRIERLEKKFNEQTDDVNEMISKRNDAIAKARRQLDEAKGLMMLFLVEKEVEHAVEAANLVVTAQASLRDDLKKKFADEIKALREAKKKEGALAGKK
jgi:hypothetical protein